MKELHILPAHCEHPDIILNPLVPELVAKYRNYTLRGVEHIFSKSFKSLLYAFKPSFFNPKSLGITYNDICSCYITDFSNGERYPLYIQVPCGHCEICKHNKMMSFVERCKLETQLYDCLPFFITLTYDEFNKKECGVYLRDVQLFFKRLRINLFRKGYRSKIRFVLVSEYGTKTHRPHYHTIIWGLRPTDILSYREIGDLIEKSWSNGFITFRLINTRDDKAFFYTAKYLSKDCYIPEGCNKPFMVSSNRGGSIGAGYYKQLREHLISTLNTKLKYVNKWSHKVADVRLDGYALNKLLPSFSRSVPYSIKTRVRRFVLNYRYLENLDDINYLPFKDTFKQVCSVFPKYFYVDVLSNFRPSLMGDKSYQKVIHEMLDDEPKILKVLSMDNLDDLYKLSLYRFPFIDKLMSVAKPIDLLSLSYKYRRQREVSHEFDVL